MSDPTDTTAHVRIDMRFAGGTELVVGDTGELPELLDSVVMWARRAADLPAGPESELIALRDRVDELEGYADAVAAWLDAHSVCTGKDECNECDLRIMTAAIRRARS